LGLTETRAALWVARRRQSMAVIGMTRCNLGHGGCRDEAKQGERLQHRDKRLAAGRGKRLR
jgi:hypothetical protein